MLPPTIAQSLNTPSHSLPHVTHLRVLALPSSQHFPNLAASFRSRFCLPRRGHFCCFSPASPHASLQSIFDTGARVRLSVCINDTNHSPQLQQCRKHRGSSLLTRRLSLHLKPHPPRADRSFSPRYSPGFQAPWRCVQASRVSWGQTLGVGWGGLRASSPHLRVCLRGAPGSGVPRAPAERRSP